MNMKFYYMTLELIKMHKKQCDHERRNEPRPCLSLLSKEDSNFPGGCFGKDEKMGWLMGRYVMAHLYPSYRSPP